MKTNAKVTISVFLIIGAAIGLTVYHEYAIEWEAQAICRQHNMMFDEENNVWQRNVFLCIDAARVAHRIAENGTLYCYGTR